MSELGWRACFSFPLQDEEARRDVLIGAALLLIPLIGWIFNLGHRLDVVHRLFHHDPPWFRGFAPWGLTFKRGLMAATAITLYLSPAIVFALTAWYTDALYLFAPAGVCFVLAIYALPGGMTYNAAYGDIRYLYRPDKAFARAREGGMLYLRAWAIALAAISLSLLGLLALGLGFLVTSVWAWMVVGYAFSKALSLKAALPCSDLPCR